MKLIVFGGTGKTGLAVIERAVQVESNIVTVYARRPNRIPAHLIEKIKIIKGDVLDAEAVKNSLQGQDVVISCLGKGLNLAPTTLISEGTKNVLDGMIFHKIKRIFVVSISSRLASSKSKGPWILKNVSADHDRMLEELKKRSEDVEWCALMVPEIFQLPPTKNFQVAINRRPGPITVVAADMAEFMVTCLADDEKWNIYKNNFVGMTSTVTFSQLLTTSQGKIWMGLVAIIASVTAFTISKLFF